MTDQDLDLVLEDLDQVGLHIFPGRLQDEIAGLCQPSKKDDSLRAREHNEVGQGKTEDRPGEVEDRFGQLIPFDGRVIYQPRVEFVIRGVAKQALFLAVLQQLDSGELYTRCGSIA